MKNLLTLLPVMVLISCSEQRVIDGNNLADGSYQGYPNSNQNPAAPEGQAYDEFGALVDTSSTQLTGIQGESDRIVLSDYSQEQQRIDRENYARQLDQIEASRVEIFDAPTANVDTSVNVVAYARSTPNQLGESRYTRSGRSGNCRIYGSADAAQRAFLQNGGPSQDSLGLDPDGDGFACDFDPSFYRSLRY